MSRFTAGELQEAYSRPYVLGRKVTMVTDFAKDETVDLLPTQEICVRTGQSPFLFHHVKWIAVTATANKARIADGWIPKSVLHDFAYAALAPARLTGVSFGGDKIDYDTHQPTARTGPNPSNVLSRCLDCGAGMNAHKVYEDEDLAGKMATLIGMLTAFEGSLSKRHGAQWVPKLKSDSIMLGMARTGAGKYVLAYSGSDHAGRAVLEDVMKNQFASKTNSKGKWSLATDIPTNTMQMTRRNGQPLTVAEVQAVFTATGVTNIADLERLQCAAPKLLHHAFTAPGGETIASMTEAWFQPSNARTHASSVGKPAERIRRHGQTIPSCTRCSTVVRQLLCP
jgi:hypothetical protein